MSDALTQQEALKSIEPRSDQLNADDLLTGPITVTITNVRRGDKDQPVIVEIEGHQPFKPCKTMRRVLIATFSDDPKQWVGQRMTLYCDPDVLWAGVRVGGIRISHLSGMTSPTKFLITQTRGKRVEVTISPIVDKPSVNPQKPQHTNIGKWGGNVTPEKRGAASLAAADKLYVARNLDGLEAMLAKVKAMETDFPPLDFKSLVGMIEAHIAGLKLQQAGTGDAAGEPHGTDDAENQA